MDKELEILKQYILISKYRYSVLCVLSIDDVKIPTQISMETGIRKNHISKVLSELKEKSLIECINEDSKRGRLYRLTSKGALVRKEIVPVNERYIDIDGLIYDNKTDTYYNLKDTVDLLNSQDESIMKYQKILLY